MYTHMYIINKKYLRIYLHINRLTRTLYVPLTRTPLTGEAQPPGHGRVCARYVECLQTRSCPEGGDESILALTTCLGCMSKCRCIFSLILPLLPCLT